MCGIVGATSNRNIVPILLEGLKRLEYRGYDSAGIGILKCEKIHSWKATGKVKELETCIAAAPDTAKTGIAHTRWATHGKPLKHNAHPHHSERLAVVHNGIIENHFSLRKTLQEQGYEFNSDTDTEVIAHLLASHYRKSEDMLVALRNTLNQLRGAYAIGVIHEDQPEMLYCARQGSPLVIGVGSEEHFIASDPLALLQVTDTFVYLEEGDHAVISPCGIKQWDASNNPKKVNSQRYEHAEHSMEKGEYRHYMLKEIHEQPAALRDTLTGLFAEDRVLTAILGPEAEKRLHEVQNIHIVACGTSYHAGLVARYWIEDIAGLACNVEIASEFRYRRVVVPANTLLVCISQSGETADTLAALRHSRHEGYLVTLAICNVPGSSLAREADWRLLTKAGPEIGVASTKAFTTQLTALLWLSAALAQTHGAPPEITGEIVRALRGLPTQVEQALQQDAEIQRLAERFANKQHTLFLGRGPLYPIAMEGALKLKEISYIHAEAYAAGELKHGPLALVDESMPVVSVAPNCQLLEKLKSNLEEVRARGGQLINFACETAEMKDQDGITHIHMPWANSCITPILYTLPLQLLSYYVALVKGTDVDKPRNLAKSVTVE